MSRSLEEQLKSQVRAVSGRPERVSTEMEAWQGLSAAIIDRIADRWHATERTYAVGRMEHYFSAEFLMGRALLNNLGSAGRRSPRGSRRNLLPHRIDAKCAQR